MKAKKILVYGLLLVLGLMAVIMLSKMYTDSFSHDHVHASGTGECMCECEFKSNQNENSCKEHGGCEWTGDRCITK
jgi:hypothetical protein